MTEGIAPQAALQRRIIFALAIAPAASVAALANRVGSTRPAVSRSLKKLTELGLVERRGRSCTLTSAGQTEAQRIPTSYTPGVQRAIEHHAHAQQLFGLAVADVVRNQVATGLFAKMQQATALTGFGKTAALIESAGLAKMQQATALTGFGKTAALIEGFGKARSDLFGSLVLQVSALEKAPAWWSSMVADNLGITARAVADVEAMSEALRARSRLPTARANGIERAVGRVVSAHHDLLEESLRRFLPGRAVPEAAAAIVTPTITTAAFTGTARELFVPSAPDRDSADLHRAAVWDLASRLESLGAVSSARDLRAAWEVLERRLPGWPKAGTHLMREALRETLDELAPPARVPGDEHGVVTKRAQVVWIVGGNGSLAIWVDATASSIGKLHSFLSAEAKNAGDPRMGWQGFLGLLETVTGLVRTLVDRASQRDDE